MSAAFPHEPEEPNTHQAVRRVEQAPEPSREQRGGRHDDEDAQAILDSLRSLFEIELRRAERFSARAGQAFALALGFFALAQTVAFGSFAVSLVSQHERRVTLVWGAAAALAVVGCGIAGLIADRAFKVRTIGADDLLALYSEAHGSLSVIERLAQKYATVLEEMRKGNMRRHDSVNAVQVFAGIALLLVLVELAYSLYARTS